MKLHKKRMLASGISAGVCVLMVLLFLAGEGITGSRIGELDALNAGERWSASGEPYATVTLHTDTDSAMSLMQVESYSAAMNTALLNASIASSENGSVWTYGYYAEDLVSVTGPKATASFRTMAVGGSFFTFHPLEFLYGAPFSYDRALPDGIVLDEDAAWRVFGSVDVVGMTVQIGGRDMTVTGIVRKERDDPAYEKAYGDIPRMYMSYYGYENIYGERNNITTYEAVLPDPVKSFAMNIFRNAVQINEDTMTVQENSDRYSLKNRFTRMKELPYMGMRNDRIVYPYFENELQVMDYRTAVRMMFQTAAGAFAVLGLLSAVICLFAAGFAPSAILKNGWQKLEQYREKNHTRRKKGRSGRRLPKPEKFLDE
ncbi:MAG: ABC transporter permease [Ruminococcaceae bacterium]|nr:ABC transporter permease [Oscillospiraceae bacterium]